MVKKWSIKKGFTLAEVLITLGVIGIVASLTMPTLLQNTKKSEATARLKKFISLINQALIRAESDYGMREDWIIGEMNNSDSSLAFLNKYINRMYKVMKLKKELFLI